jgi:hypothetical protein
LLLTFAENAHCQPGVMSRVSFEPVVKVDVSSVRKVGQRALLVAGAVEQAVPVVWPGLVAGQGARLGDGLGRLALEVLVDE